MKFYKKRGLDRFCRFDVYGLQTNKQKPKQGRKSIYIGIMYRSLLNMQELHYHLLLLMNVKVIPKNIFNNLKVTINMFMHN